MAYKVTQEQNVQLWILNKGIKMNNLGLDLENFTPKARQVILLAVREAERLDNNFVGTEHLLLGIVKLGEESPAANILKTLGAGLTQIKQKLEKLIKMGPDVTKVSTRTTPRLKKVLSLADRERKLLSHAYTGTEHLLLGILREGDGLAARVLYDFKLTADRVRKEIANPLYVSDEQVGMNYEMALAEAREARAVLKQAETLLINIISKLNRRV